MCSTPVSNLAGGLWMEANTDSQPWHAEGELQQSSAQSGDVAPGQANAASLRGALPAVGNDL